jgi:hypothetical protein
MRNSGFTSGARYTQETRFYVYRKVPGTLFLPGDYSRSPIVFHALLQTLNQEAEAEPKPDKT